MPYGTHAVLFQVGLPICPHDVDLRPPQLLKTPALHHNSLPFHKKEHGKNVLVARGWTSRAEGMERRYYNRLRKMRFVQMESTTFLIRKIEYDRQGTTSLKERGCLSAEFSGGSKDTRHSEVDRCQTASAGKPKRHLFCDVLRARSQSAEIACRPPADIPAQRWSVERR